MGKLLLDIPPRQAFYYAGFLVLYEFLTYIANDMIMPAMIQVVASFDAPQSAIATSLTAYILGGASLQIFLGPLSDRYGRRPVMLFGAVFFLVCTVLIASSNSMSQFLWARYFQGMGLCFIVVVGYATLQETFSEMDAIRLIALMANVAIIAPLLGPLFGAGFLYYTSWRMIFVVIGVLSLLALWGLWHFMPESVGKVLLNGKKIESVSLEPRVIWANYSKLICNPSFMLGSVALGLINVPCLVWIALSPIMLVTSAKLTLFQYSLWQLPVFSAYVVGNIFLHQLTKHCGLKKLIIIGSIFSVIGLCLLFALPYLGGSHFLWLMPGLVIYFFGTSATSAPLSRFILFSTSVGKGTASALMTMFMMMIMGGGVELGNKLYATQNNLVFGGYCAAIGVGYFLMLGLMLYTDRKTLLEEYNA